MEHSVSATCERRSFGAILRAHRQAAYLSQEELAARAELSERTVRSLEAGRVQSPRTDTVRLLADALGLSQADRMIWFQAARAVKHQELDAAIAGSDDQHRPYDARAGLSLSQSGSGSGDKVRRDGSRIGMFQAESLALRQGCNRSTQVAKHVDATETTDQPAASQGGGQAGVANDGLTGLDMRELATLRRENRRLREDVEILKRATAIFAAAAR